jgi:hypothetical protein
VTEEPYPEEPYPGFYERAAAYSTTPRLIAAPPLAPLPGQETIFRQAVYVAGLLGLSLPRTVRARWRAGRREWANGATERTAAGEVRVYLNANAYPDDLVRTCFHELQHVSDFHTGIHRQISRADMERRADAFEIRAVPTWNGLQTRTGVPR